MQHGFIGLGQMGRPMAINLARHFQVIAYDSDKDQYADLPEKVAIARTLEDLHTCDVVFLSLPNGEIIRSVLFETELSDHLPPGAIIVDTGTTEYETTLQIKSQLSERNIKFIDTPVSGMQSRAEDGTLTMMCGGSEEVVQKLTPQLSTMATTILHMGPVGSGQLTKLINQLLFDINAAAIAEILPMAVKLGLDADKIGEIVNSGTGRSYASEFFIPNILKKRLQQWLSHVRCLQGFDQRCPDNRKTTNSYTGFSCRDRNLPESTNAGTRRQRQRWYDLVFLRNC